MLNNYLFTALLAVTFLSGCQQRGQETEHAHTASGDLPALSYTLYSQHSELFVEFKPLVVGTPSRFATHVTVLGDRFRALSEGTITVSLLVNDRGIRQTATEPSVPGIYRLQLQPVVAGRGQLVFDIKTDTYTDRIVIDSVQVYPDQETALAALPEEPEANDISFLKEQAWKIDFANEVVVAQPFGEVIATSGQIQPAPGDEVVVAATLDGIVRLTGKNLVAGQPVRAGQSLVSLTTRQLVSNNLDVELARARTELERTRKAYERARQLIDKQLITASELENARAEYDNASRLLASLSGNYSEGGKAIAAPISGYIKNVLVEAGSYVAQGQPLLTIVRNRSLMIKADVPQRSYSLLPRIQTATFGVPYTDRVYSLAELGGRIVSYGRTSAEETAFVPVFMEVGNRGELIPGALVSVWLQTSSGPNALVVPESALLEEQGTYFVYVQSAGESFQKREVAVGARNGQQVEILSGVRAGERVVTKGGIQIKLASMSGALPAHGHEH